MRTILAVLSFCLIGSASAHAGYASDYGAANKHWGHARAVAGYRPDSVTRSSGNLSSQCRIAAAKGGPCGCWAAEHFGLPRMMGRLNLWLANSWLAFPHVPAAPGTAAVWPGRHVAPVVAVEADKAMVADSWATHWVSRRGLVFVDPHRARKRSNV